MSDKESILAAHENLQRKRLQESEKRDTSSGSSTPSVNLSNLLDVLDGTPCYPKRKQVKSRRLDKKAKEDVYIEPMSESGREFGDTQDVDRSINLPPRIDFEKKEIMTQNVKETVDLVDKAKNDLLNYAALSYANNTRFRGFYHSPRTEVIDICRNIANHDPEFVLKAALYIRNILNFRSLANLLLAFSSSEQSCRPYLSKYFCSVVNLPTDWLEVLDFYKAMSEKTAIPRCLVKVMKLKFGQFSDFHLQKYKSLARIPKKIERRSKQAKSLTMKTAVKVLHIKYPRDKVMKVVQARYPSNIDEFIASELPGEFDESLAGKKFKFDPIVTWERELSLNGNSANVWENLLDKNAVAYMALIRNLRNLVDKKISNQHFLKVINIIKDEEQVKKSRQFPQQFYQAYMALKEQYKDSNRNSENPKWREYNEQLQIAISEALSISVENDVPVIPGKTIVIVDVENIVNPKVEEKTKKRQENKTSKEMMELLSALIIYYRCEMCKLVLFYKGKSSPITEINSSRLDLQVIYKLRKYIVNEFQSESTSKDPDKSVENNEEDEVDISSNGSNSKGDEFDVSDHSDSNKEFECDIDGEVISDYGEYIIEFASRYDGFIKFDNIVTISESLDLYNATKKSIDYYRQVQNSNLLSMNLFLSNVNELPSTTRNDIFIVGASEKVLRYLSDRDVESQVKRVNKIDQEFGLVEGLKEEDLFTGNELVRHFPDLPRWRNVRIFVSSTFLDMTNERDILFKQVFPELRSRARALSINLYDIDLRWGVTEDSVEGCIKVCLNEARKNDIFIGILGSRYGYSDFSYENIDKIRHRWITQYPPGASITELEIIEGAFEKYKCTKDRAFFYLRDESYVDNVPNVYKDNLVDTCKDKVQRLRELKSKIISSGFEVYRNYPCSYAGLTSGGVVKLRNLETFAERVFNNVWNCLEKLRLPVERTNDFLCDDINLEMEYMKSKFEEMAIHPIVRKSLFNSAIAVLKNRGGNQLVIIEGSPGSGRTTFMCQIIKELQSQKYGLTCLFYLSDGGHSSANMMLNTFIHEMSHEMEEEIHFKDDNEDTVIASFSNVLKQFASEGKRILLAVDGFEWLRQPHLIKRMFKETFNYNTSLLLTSSDFMKDIVIPSKMNQSTFVLDDLTYPERKEIAISTFARFSKALEESSRNNQLRMLLTKQHAKFPLYVQFACEEIRKLTTDFEMVSLNVSKLPGSFPRMVGTSLDRLKKYEGTLNVYRLLSLLLCVNDGISEVDLLNLLYLDSQFDLNKESIENIICSLGSGDPLNAPRLIQSEFFALRDFLSGYLTPSNEHDGGIISFAHKEIKDIVVECIRKTKPFTKYTQHSHKLIAVYYESHCDPFRNHSWHSPCPQMMIKLISHAIRSDCPMYAEKLLKDVSYLEARCALGCIDELLKDYIELLQTSSSLEKDKRFYDMFTFIRNNRFILQTNPNCYLEMMLQDSNTHLLIEATQLAEKKNLTSALRPINTTTPRTVIYQSTENLAVCVDAFAGTGMVAIGTKIGSVMIIDSTTSSIRNSFYGHNDCISGVNFLDENRLASVSHDASLSVWDLLLQIRINNFQSDHTGKITSMDAGHHLIATCSYDGQIAVQTPL
ncbi:hypothetical protein ACOME3_002574 [Neoechinorhynchus agilis]